MNRSSFRWTLGLAAWLVANIGSAGVMTITDTQPMLDWPGPGVTAMNPDKLTFALFDYSSQAVLTDITGIDFSLTLQCAATMPGDLDFDNLTLGLDGIDTGIKLNGFTATDLNSLSFHTVAGGAGFPDSATISQILSNLNDDHQLFASILDSTPGDNCYKMYSAFDTTLSLTGPAINPGGGTTTPEPISLLVWSVAAGGLWAGTHRRIKSRKQKAGNPADTERTVA